MAWFLNRYACEACEAAWADEWCCACDEECPQCDRTCSPEDSEELKEQGTCGHADCPDCASPGAAQVASAEDFRAMLVEGIDAVLSIVAAWEQGDLAGAVNMAEAWAREAASALGHETKEDSADD